MAGPRLARFLARAVMALGLVVGVGAIGVWALNIQLHVPAWMWRVAVVKLGLVAAGAMIAAGALLQRYLKKSQYARGTLLPDESPRAFGAPVWPPAMRPRQRTPQQVTTPTSREAP